MRKTLYTQSLSVRALPITSITINGVRSGSVIDTNIFGNEFRSVLFVIETGNVTDGTHAVTVQDSDDGVTFTNVDSSLIQGSLPSITAPDDFRHDMDFGVFNMRRYLRIQVTSTGVSSGGTIGATAILAVPSSSPALRTGS